MKDINVHMSVLTNFDKFTGCTLHRVIEQVDKGAIISQYQMLVNTDSEYELKKSVQELEKRCFTIYFELHQRIIKIYC